MSTKAFFTHHTQQMSKAAVMYDAKAIRKQVTYLKQRAFGCAVRATEVAADDERAYPSGHFKINLTYTLIHRPPRRPGSCSRRLWPAGG